MIQAICWEYYWILNAGLFLYLTMTMKFTMQYKTIHDKAEVQFDYDHITPRVQTLLIKFNMNKGFVITHRTFFSVHM